MKVGILAGGKGTRLAEETVVRPKPMVEIGGIPMLLHIMKIYAHYGFNDFTVALGYKGEVIKRYFYELASLSGDLTFHLGKAEAPMRNISEMPNWTINLVETGYETLTGGRIKRMRPWVGNSTFLVTWGDGVSDVNIRELVKFHKSHGKLATVTAVRPQARYGHMRFDGSRVIAFEEKPQTAEGWINGAFFVLEPQVFDYIEGDMVMFEHAPMEHLASDGQLMAFFHDGFWSAMDTLRDKKVLQDLWDTGCPPWAVWKD